MRPHKRVDWHPGLPSFKDQYRYKDDEIVHMAYNVVFNPARKRYITGGIATQFYIPLDRRRGSDDIDINDLERMTYTSFFRITKEDVSRLDDMGKLKEYDVIGIKKNHSFVIHICNWFKVKGDDRFYLNIEFPRLGNRILRG